MKVPHFNPRFNLGLLAAAGFLVLLYFPLRTIYAANARTTILASAGKPLVYLNGPHSLQVSYMGAVDAVAALRTGAAIPTALAAADFDANGAMDVVVGYSTNSGGVLALMRGNPDAYAPRDHSFYKKSMQGIVAATFLPKADVVMVPESPDQLLTGDFNRDGHQDLLVAARGGTLYLLAGDGRGHLLAPQVVPLPGPVVALAVTGDAHVAVSMDSPDGPRLMILAPSPKGLVASSIQALPDRGEAVAWGNLGAGADLAVGAGGHVVVIYNALSANPQTETLTVPFHVLALTLGDFIWDRDGRTELSVLAEDGSIHILQHGTLDTRPLKAADIPDHRAAVLARSKRAHNPSTLGPWKVARQLPYTGSAPSGPISPTAFSSPRLAASPTHDLMILDGGRSQLNILDTSGTTTSPSATVSFSNTPVAALALPQKINAGRDIIVLTSGQAAPILIPAEPDLSFFVTTVNDEDDAGACPSTSTVTSGAGADGVLSLREAVCEANNNGSVISVINVPAGAYALSISTFGGTGSFYESGEIQVGNISGANISIVGNGTASNTIITQTDGVDRVFEQDQPLAGNVAVSISNVTLTGGTPTTGLDAELGGGAILGGGTNGDDLTVTNVVMSNNTTAAAAPGGAIGFLVANFTAVDSIFSNNTATQSVGGACACGATGGQGNLVFTNSIFANNIVTDASTLSPSAYDMGGALNLSPGTSNAATISGSSFTTNQAQGPNGIGGAVDGNGAIIIGNSRIVGNSAITGSGFGLGGAGSIATAIDNWWGCNAGPNGTGCDNVFIDTGGGASGSVNPWLVLGISASSSQIIPSGTATLTADLAHDSGGTGGFSVPDGTAVNFGGTLGTTNPSSATTTSGQAISTFTAGDTTGVGSGTATVDNQTVSVNVNIGQSPVITSGNNTIFTVGAASAFSVTTTGSPNPSITESGALPGGVTFVDNGNGTGTLFGTPAAGTGGIYNTIFTGQNGFSPSATQSFTLTVNQAATITSANSANFTLGTAGSFTVTTNAFPTAGIGVGPLPSGLGFSDNHNGTGTLSGTPMAQGVFTITFTASNAVGSPAVQTFKLTVGVAPTITNVSSNPNPSTYGQSVTFSATVSAASGTPTGTVTFKNGTAVLGSATLAGGVATFTTTTLGAGTRSITAVYGGNATFSGSTSAVLSQVVSQGPSTVALTSALNPSTYGQSVTFSATVSAASGTPTGTVTFKNGTAVLGSATLAGGVATFTTTTLGAGTRSITAVYGGNATFSGSTSAVLSQVVSQGPSTVALTSALNPSTYGQSVTFSATVSAASGTPTGTVTFKNGTAVLGSATLAGGVATFTTTTLAVGTRSITAVYGGNATFSGSTSAVLSQVVSQGPSTVALTSALNPSTYGQSVTFSATVSAASGTPTGTVTFKNGTAVLGSATLAGGVATFTTTTLAVGTRSITAVYGGNATFSGSTSAVLSQVVSQGPSTVALTSALNPSTYGQSVTFSATVSAASGTPTGTVTFKNGTAVLGSATLAGGVATFTTTTLAVGTESITAVYGGTATFSGSTSAVLSQVVSQGPSTVALTSALNPSTYGQSVTFSATVSAASGTPTGTVTFKNGTAVLGSATLAGGVATFTTTTLAVGTRSITAVYGGNATFSGSTSAVLSQVVSQGPSTVALTSALNPSTYGQSVTFTATVSASSGYPTGTVTFKNGTAVLGSATLAGGVATFTTTTLAVGTRSITAVYGGNATFSGSTSAVLSQVVSRAPSTVALTSALNPSIFGQSVTFSATVSAASGTPTGTVTFMNGTAVLGSATLAGGVATSTTTTLAVGTESITAVYGGNATFSGSTSAVLSQVVSRAPSTVALTSALNPSTYGQSVTFTATVSASSGYPTGTVTFKNGTAVLGSATLAGGVATFTTTTLAVGTGSIIAVYGGDTTFSSSTSAVLSQVVSQGPSTVVLTSALNPSSYGQSVTFSATVSTTSGTPTGTVTFMNGTAVLGSATLAGGVATFTTTTLAVGTESITAVYGGTANFSGSTSAVLSQVVNQGQTLATVSLTSALNPSIYGQSVTFTATVSAASGTPTGTVTFMNGTAVLGSATLAGGVATFTSTTLAVGTGSIIAVYGGDTTFSGSTSAVVIQVVSQAPTTVTLTSSPNPSTLGQSAMFTATVSAASGTPTGTVTFMNGTAVLGSATLAGGVATFTSTTLAVGTGSITAVYGGDTTFSGSTSAVLSQTVSLAQLAGNISVLGSQILRDNQPWVSKGITFDSGAVWCCDNNDTATFNAGVMPFLTSYGADTLRFFVFQDMLDSEYTPEPVNTSVTGSTYIQNILNSVYVARSEGLSVILVMEPYGRAYGGSSGMIQPCQGGYDLPTDAGWPNDSFWVPNAGSVPNLDCGASTSRAWQALIAATYSIPGGGGASYSLKSDMGVMLEVYLEPTSPADLGWSGPNSAIYPYPSNLYAYKGSNTTSPCWAQNVSSGNVTASSAVNCESASAWALWQATYTNVIADIRNTGANNVVLVNGLYWSKLYNESYQPTDSSYQLIYAVHPWLASGFTTPKDWDAWFGEFAALHPVIASAFDALPALSGDNCFITMPTAANQLMEYLYQANIGLGMFAYDLLQYPALFANYTGPGIYTISDLTTFPNGETATCGDSKDPEGTGWLGYDYFQAVVNQISPTPTSLTAQVSTDGTVVLASWRGVNPTSLGYVAAILPQQEAPLFVPPPGRFIDLQAQTAVSFNSLAPGNYTVEVWSYDTQNPALYSSPAILSNITVNNSAVNLGISQNLANPTTGWTTLGSSITAQVAGTVPDGTSASFSMVEDISSGQHGIGLQNVGLTVGENYSFSVWVNLGTNVGGRFLSLVDASGSTAIYTNYCNPALGTLISWQNSNWVNSGPLSYWAVGWYLCALDFTAQTNSNSLWINLNEQLVYEYQGDGQSGLQLWQPQLLQISPE